MTESELTAVQAGEAGTGLRRLESFVVASLLVVGLYCPTSATGTPSKVLLGIDYVVCAILLGLLMLKRRDLPSPVGRLALVAVLPLLVAFTAIFGLRNRSYGELASFAVLAIVWMLNLRQVRFPAWLYHVFSAISILNIVLGVAVLAGNSLVGGFLTRYYAQFDEAMVPGMMLMRKPVLTFATHSLAGFFFYLFFYANFRTYVVKGKKFYLIMALCYLALTAGLLSVTGLLMALLGSVQVMFYFWRRLPHRWLVAAGLLAMLGIFAGGRNLDPAMQRWNAVSEVARAVLSSSENGFQGRFLRGGTMRPSMDYVKQHPFRPLGVSTDPNLLVADMGLLDYFIRGSIFLVVWAYAGLFLLLRRSLLAKWDLWFLFGVILAFELGFSVLAYFRMQYLLPFFIVYFNDLRRFQAATVAGALGENRLAA